jgi:hypothetical protein
MSLGFVAGSGCSSVVVLRVIGGRIRISLWMCSMDGELGVWTGGGVFVVSVWFIILGVERSTLVGESGSCTFMYLSVG